MHEMKREENNLVRVENFFIIKFGTKIGTCFSYWFLVCKN